MREANTIYPFLWTCVVIYAVTLAVGTWASYDTAAAVQRAVLLGAGLALIPLARGHVKLRGLGLDRKSAREASDRPLCVRGRSHDRRRLVRVPWDH